MLSRRRFLHASGVLGLTVAVAGPAFARAGSISPLAAAKAGLERFGGRVTHSDVVGVADFSLASAKPRLHLVDMISGRTSSFLVAHGRGSDPSHSGWLSKFSNAEGSNCTSEGAFLTGDYYVGSHGRSMRLAGLEPTNSNAESRAIVVHAAPYVGPGIVRAQGVLGRSEGCFALSDADLPRVLQQLGPGRLLISARL